MVHILPPIDVTGGVEPYNYSLNNQTILNGNILSDLNPERIVFL